MHAFLSRSVRRSYCTDGIQTYYTAISAINRQLEEIDEAMPPKIRARANTKAEKKRELDRSGTSTVKSASQQEEKLPLWFPQTASSSLEKIIQDIVTANERSNEKVETIFTKEDQKIQVRWQLSGKVTGHMCRTTEKNLVRIGEEATSKAAFGVAFAEIGAYVTTRIAEWHKEKVKHWPDVTLEYSLTS